VGRITRHARRMAYRSFAREHRANARNWDRYASPTDKLCKTINTLLVWALISFGVFLLSPIAIRCLILLIWGAIVYAIVWVIRNVPRRPKSRQVLTPAVVALPRPAPEPMVKECPGPLERRLSPCPKSARIAERAIRCTYCERLRPQRDAS
jgi:hypothetical protein